MTVETIASRIVVVRGQKVLLDADLAVFYAVETQVLVQVVKRTKTAFPTSSRFILVNPKLPGRNRKQTPVGVIAEESTQRHD